MFPANSQFSVTLYTVYAFTSLLLFIIVPVKSSDIEPGTDYLTLYVTGAEAYLKERWFECLNLMRGAIAQQKIHRNVLNKCRLQCKDAALIEIDANNFLDPVYLDAAMRKHTCIKTCEQLSMPGHLTFNGTLGEQREIEKQFGKYEPYNYMQMCAYKSDNLEQAYSSAYTYALFNQDHEYARNNVEYYRAQPGVKDEMFRNLELKSCQETRAKGVEFYLSEQWKESIEIMEESLLRFYEDEDECSLECERPIDHPNFPDFYNRTFTATSDQAKRELSAGHWMEILSCKTSCLEKLSTYGNKLVENFYADHFSYLQFSYYKIGNINKAVENAMSYLLFKPDDPNMIYNRKFFAAMENITEADFVPGEQALGYYNRRLVELKMQQIAGEEFNRLAMKRKMRSPTTLTDSIYGPRNQKFLESLDRYLEVEAGGATIEREGDSLEGTGRLVVDKLVSTEDCQKLYQLTKVETNRTIDGLTIDDVTKLLQEGKIETEALIKLLETSEKMRQMLHTYFNLQVPLLFQQTSIRCRTFVAGQKDDDEETVNLSRLDAMECSGESNSTCAKQGRDFVSLMYLNQDFEGGNFHFTFENGSLQHEIEAKSGRSITLFSEDEHGSTPVTRGESCALVVWFTLSPVHQELAHADAKNVLRMAGKGLKSLSQVSLESQDYMKAKNYKLALNEDDLDGSQRYAVDNVASQEQCEALIRLTNSEGSAGSGYREGFSHTKHESFVGLTVEAAAKMVAQHKVPSNDVRLYLDLSNDMRQLTKQLLVPAEQALYNSFTHLVCRTALNDENLDRTDLSHPIHSDNCIIQQDNTCKKERPAYTERDFSALLYLNDDFKGGDFFFAHQNMSVQSSMKPKCGRLVAFNSSHYHGVKPVLSGQRCAVALWFTLDRNFEETSFGQAYKLLDQLEAHAFGPDQYLHVDL